MGSSDLSTPDSEKLNWSHLGTVCVCVCVGGWMVSVSVKSVTNVYGACETGVEG